MNAFFAAAEIAFISLNDAKIDVMAREGNKKAKKIKEKKPKKIKPLKNKEKLYKKLKKQKEKKGE